MTNAIVPFSSRSSYDEGIPQTRRLRACMHLAGLSRLLLFAEDAIRHCEAEICLPSYFRNRLNLAQNTLRKILHGHT